jgi:hypothetical protein
MRKLVGVVVLFSFVAMVGFAVVQAHAADMTWTGWITDAACQAKPAMWSNKECAIKCVKEKGSSYVFVVSADKKVVKIQNQDAVKEANVGVEVKVTGSLTDDGSLHISKVEAASK